MSKFYESSPFPSAREREALAKAIDLPQRQVQTWFQNRRQRNKDPTSIRPRGVDAQTHEWLSLDMPTYGKPAQPPAAPKPTKPNGKPAQPPAAPKPTKPNRMVDYTTPLDVYTTPLATAFFEQARQPPPQEPQPRLEPPPRLMWCTADDPVAVAARQAAMQSADEDPVAFAVRQQAAALQRAATSQDPVEALAAVLSPAPTASASADGGSTPASNNNNLLEAQQQHPDLQLLMPAIALGYNHYHNQGGPSSSSSSTTPPSQPLESALNAVPLPNDFAQLLQSDPQRRPTRHDASALLEAFANKVDQALPPVQQASSTAGGEGAGAGETIMQDALQMSSSQAPQRHGSGRG